MRLFQTVDAALQKFEAACAAAVHPRVRPHRRLAERHADFIKTQASAAALGGIGLPLAATVTQAWGIVTLIAWALFLMPFATARFVAVTGRISAAHFLSAVQLTGLVMLAAMVSGGPASFVVAWFVLVPIEAALSAHRWVMIAATGLSGGAFLLLAFLASQGLLPDPALAAIHARELALMSILAAILYAGGLVAGIQRLHRAAADQIARARDEALEASRAKSMFLATMSHELKTPLATIIGFAEFLHRDLILTARDGKSAEYCRIMHEQGEHLLGLVNSVLDASKLEAGTFTIDAEHFNVADLATRTAAALQLGAETRGIRLVVERAPGLVELNGDRRACRQILINLIGNALKFARSGDTVTVSVACDGDELMLRIADTGPGIAPHHLERLGQPFYQAESGYARRHEGAGLGLSIVKGLVALHAGSVAIASTLGAGTTVTVRLPVHGPQAAAGNSDPASVPLETTASARAAVVSAAPCVPAATLAAVAASALAPSTLALG